MREGAFSPKAWLANGTDRVLQADAAGPWEARWQVGDVTSRLTMLGDNPSTVFSLQTYPIDNAVVTPRNPPCPTICVRRQTPGLFLAVGDAWQSEPNLKSASASRDGHGVLLQSRSHTYHLLVGAGRADFADGFSLSSDASFALVRDANAVMLVHGSSLALQTPSGDLTVQLDHPASLAAEREGKSTRQEISGDIQYDTFGGLDHLRPVPNVKVRFQGRLWPLD